MSYSYRADGVKVKKVHHYFHGRIKADAFTTTDYIDGFQYEGDTGLIGNMSGLQFFATSEGYFDYVNNRYIYHYNDHLGNVRVSFAREGNTAVIVQQNDYYAFGLKHSGGLSGNGSYKYEYNGKELQEELGMYDYGARFYMPDLGRWGVIDPLAEVTPHLSPYHYANNNPIMFNDPTGMLSQSFIDQVWNSPSGTVWTNNGIGFTNNWGGMMDYEGNALNFGAGGSLYRLNSYIDATGAVGGGGGTYTPNFTGQLFFELIAVGYTKESVAMKPVEADINKVLQINTMKNLIAMLNTAAGVKDKLPTFLNTKMSAEGKSEGWRILLNLSKINTVYDLAYVMGHEINHTITDYFKNTFKDIVRSNTQMGSQAYIIYSEYRSYSWEVSLGYERITTNPWDYVYQKHGPHPELEARFREMGKSSPFYNQSAFDLASKHLNQLDADYKVFYKKLMK
ncbi:MULTISPECIES: RHS repeat domain-containing protein [Chryseobacterium]|uniref:RHS repeat-associated core domain n=1 Tax=Chryseobacterium taihuense TaxID=1141221 RepID=A0A4U8WLN4_9FLAO|nr:MULTISPECIES: RHS repeat-associated core domain-containing protein [Chryseobacterium]QQV02988.1 RHS repeat-associated core domain-containing protein [Chryseobacterium sp. FDAARGOS 1104]VFB03728.1 RHS repeat-associated core domain [Chryseobacterium taihuense]